MSEEVCFLCRQPLERGHCASCDDPTPDLISLPREVVEQVREALNEARDRMTELVEPDISVSPVDVYVRCRDTRHALNQALALLASIGE